MERELGEIKASYRQRIPLTWWALILLAVIALFISIWLVNYASISEGYYHGAIPAGRVFQRGMIGVVILIGLFIYGIIKVITNPKQRLEIHQYGVKFSGKQTGTYLWDDFVGIQADYRSRWWWFFPIKQERVVFIFLDKSTITIDHHINQLEKARKQIEGNVYPLIQDKMRAGYVKGATLQFGKVLMHQSSGIKVEGKVYRWGSIRKIDVVNGLLQIDYYQAGGQTGAIRTEVNQISNLPVLMTFAKERLAQPED